MAEHPATNEPHHGEFAAMIQGEYEQACSAPSEINEHLPVLRQLAAEVGHVTEFGVRAGVSTRAFLAAGAVLRSYDISLDKKVRELFAAAVAAGWDAAYSKGDTRELDIDETGLLFVDTLHTYGQLSKELERHQARVRRYIAFHDTSTFGMIDEDLIQAVRRWPQFMRRGMAERRCRKDLSKGRGRGLLPAIMEFLASHRQWRVHAHYIRNSGLTVIARDAE